MFDFPSFRRNPLFDETCSSLVLIDKVLEYGLKLFERKGADNHASIDDHGRSRTDAVGELNGCLLVFHSGIDYRLNHFLRSRIMEGF